MRTPAAILERNSVCAFSSRVDRQLSEVGLNRMPSYQLDRRYSVLTLHMCLTKAGSSVTRSFRPTRVIVPEGERALSVALFVDALDVDLVCSGFAI